MKRNVSMIAGVLLILGMAGLLMGGCCCGTCGDGGETGGSGCSGCSRIMESGSGWCDGCDKGMVDGKKVACKGCYGQKTGGPACPACSGK